LILYSKLPMSTEDPFDITGIKQGEWVEEPNQRRGGESGVQRIHDADGRLLYAKRQVGHIYRSWRYPLGRPTVLRERDALLALRRTGGECAGAGVLRRASKRQDKQWRAIVGDRRWKVCRDRQLVRRRRREQYGEAVHDRVLQAMVRPGAHALGRWQHGCLYIKHVFVRVTGRAKGSVSMWLCWTWKNAGNA
jgi:hypothetical protein